MMTMAELERKINNLAQTGTICEVYEKQKPKDHEDYALYAKADIMGRETDFFPIFTQHSTFKKHYVPPCIGEQVKVINPFGNANMGFILRGVVPNDEEPITHTEKDRETEYIEYRDGTKIEVSLYDKRIKMTTPNEVELTITKGSKLKVQVSGDIEIESDNKIELTCKDAEINATSVVVRSPSIDLGAGFGTFGVITEASVCPFTGVPHIQGSNITRSLP
jgi:phage baseplate assembly protein V